MQNNGPAGASSGDHTHVIFLKSQVRAQRYARVCDGLGVWMQVALSGDQRSVPGDLAEHVDRDTGVGHPSKAGVTQVVTAQMLVAEVGDDLIPVGRVA